ncbi:hypothetical protein E1B28_012756 [Marasmius oreades]|uniref:IgA Peptidase M64 n=1 Tax=Marasmius oreades TaxID=181124 RepID=A0A9P7RSR9_9AGAR|nr:uncharacterized protein E1B28_012756 [Marasmius oreades]KAG7088792.1 hypothetical protein E1B28_012756 [Marasmius oreades]
MGTSNRFTINVLCALTFSLCITQVLSGNKCISQLGIRKQDDSSKSPYLRLADGSYRSQTTFNTRMSPLSSLEVTPLVVTGMSSNRVDLVFFSDGYTGEEKAKFIDDARYLAEELSTNQTFNTVKPLMNFWAAFVPSRESGIGSHGHVKDTPFGLYRDGTELRAVYAAYPEVAEFACMGMLAQCNYPILLGNDPLYGGLGGRPTIITSSRMNGPQILRHELGHSIIPVGEEYDGGFAYFGVNAYHDLKRPVPWAHHLTDPENVRVERAIMPLQDYAWSMLNTTTPWKAKFESSGMYARYLVRTSLSGLPKKEDLKVELDGKDLGWEPKAGLGVDRWLYDFYVDEPLDGGEHEVSFTLMNSEIEEQAQMCSVEVLEFGNEDEFTSTPGYYGVFPTFSEDNKTTYRPTNEDCLMRQVTTPNFCKVCLEGLWLALLRRVSIIDYVIHRCDGKYNALEVNLLPLAHLREEDTVEGESYTIRWKRDGELLGKFANETTIHVIGEEALGTYELEVEFTTPEVVLDPMGRLKSKLEIYITGRCDTRLQSRGFLLDGYKEVVERGEPGQMITKRLGRYLWL